MIPCTTQDVTEFIQELLEYNCTKADRCTRKHIDSTKVLVRTGPGGLYIWPLGYAKYPKCANYYFFFYLLKGNLATKYY